MVDVVFGQRSDADDRARVAALQPFEQLRPAAFRPRCGHAEHGLGEQGVAEVVEGSERLRVGPVQVLYHQDTAAPVAVGAQKTHDRLGEQQRGVLRGAVLAAPGRHEPPEVRAEPDEIRESGTGAERNAPRNASTSAR